MVARKQEKAWSPIRVEWFWGISAPPAFFPISLLPKRGRESQSREGTSFSLFISGHQREKVWRWDGGRVGNWKLEMIWKKSRQNVLALPLIISFVTLG